MSAAGSIRKDRKRGTWSFVVDLPPVNGKRNQVYRRGFATQAEARDELDRVRGISRAGRSIGAKRLTFGDYLNQRWLVHLDADDRLKPTTKQSYRSAVKHLVRHAGHVRLVELDGGHLDAVTTALLDCSASLRHQVHVVAHKSLDDAVRWRLIPFNVAADAPPPAQPRPKPAAWSPAQVRVFLDYASADRWAALWLLAATTGMRRGELVGLRWEQVDLDRGELTVSENVTVADGRTHRGTTKTDRIRPLRLDPWTVSTLRAWRRQQVAELLVLGEHRPDHDYVFTWPDGQLVHPAVVTRTFGRIVARAELPKLRLHSLRHAWATNALDAGVDVKDVSTRLGHSSVRTTLDIYVAPSSDRDAAAAALMADMYRAQ